MFRLSRRSFVGWLASVGAALGFASRRTGALSPAAPLPQLQDRESQVLIVALAEAILPSELGTEGAARAGREFARWSAGHRKGVELLHPYGSAELSETAALPTAEWRRQLVALDAEARRAHGRGFSALGTVERVALVRTALSSTVLTGMPTARSARHVAVALLSRYYDSPEATDLCYRAQIRKDQCRPLVNTTRQPLPLAPGAGGRS